MRSKKNQWDLVKNILTIDDTAIIDDDPYGWFCELNDGTIGFADNRAKLSPFEIKETDKKRFSPTEIMDNTHFLVYKENGKKKYKFFKLSDVSSFYLGFGWTYKGGKRDIFSFKFNCFKGKDIDHLKNIYFDVNPTAKRKMKEPVDLKIIKITR